MTIDQIITELQQHKVEDAAAAAAAISDLVAANTRTAAVQAEFDAYKKSHPDAPAPAKTTLFGACPAPGGSATDVAAQLRVSTKFDSKPVTVRQFLATAVAPRAPKDKVLRVHVSWNMSGMKPADVTQDWVKKVTANLLADDRVEVIHEADKKVTDGTRTFADCVAYKNNFYTAVKAVRPDLKVVNTLTGGAFASYGGDKEERWGAVKADYAGVDCDGVHDNTGPTIDTTYQDEIDSAVAFIKKYAANGYTGIVVPEWGISRPTFDKDGTIRAKWITDQAPIFVKAGVLDVNWYDYAVGTVSDVIVTGSPEDTAFQTLVNGNQ